MSDVSRVLPQLERTVNEVRTWIDSTPRATRAEYAERLMLVQSMMRSG